jgi:hypothetical protein
MATFESIFPTFLAKCGELHTLLLSVAYALFIAGVIVTVMHRFTHRSALHLMLRLFLLTSLLVFLPVWGNQIQQLLHDSVLSGLGVDPANVYQQFNELLVIKRDPTTDPAWWNIIGRLQNFTSDIIITAILWFVGQLASLMMYWGYVFQKVILNLGYALSPLLIGFMAIPSLRHIGKQYLLHLVGVLLWPLGWAVAALVTQGILDFMTDPSLQFVDPTSTLSTLQKTIGVAVVGFWIIFSTIAAPLIIQKVIASGALAGGELLSGGAHAAVQTATAAVGGAVVAAPSGVPLATAAAAGTAGALALISSAGGAGHAGSIVTNAGGLGARDLSGDKAARQLLTQLLQHLGRLPPISPATSLPPKI